MARIVVPPYPMRVAIPDFQAVAHGFDGRFEIAVKTKRLVSSQTKRLSLIDSPSLALLLEHRFQNTVEVVERHLHAIHQADFQRRVSRQ
jgi:hypothetical protein